MWVFQFDRVSADDETKDLNAKKATLSAIITAAQSDEISQTQSLIRHRRCSIRSAVNRRSSRPCCSFMNFPTSPGARALAHLWSKNSHGDAEMKPSNRFCGLRNLLSFDDRLLICWSIGRGFWCASILIDRSHRWRRKWSDSRYQAWTGFPRKSFHLALCIKRFDPQQFWR